MRLRNLKIRSYLVFLTAIGLILFLANRTFFLDKLNSKETAASFDDLAVDRVSTKAQFSLPPPKKFLKNNGQISQGKPTPPPLELLNDEKSKWKLKG